MKKIFSKKKKEEEVAEAVAHLTVEEPPAAPAAAAPSISTITIEPADDGNIESGGKISVRVIKGKNIQLPAGTGKLKIICIVEYDKNQVTVDSTNDDGMNPVFKNRSHFDVARPDGELMFSVWGKTINGKQVFIGQHQLRPTLAEDKLFENWYHLTNELGENAGELEVQYTYKKAAKDHRMQFEDFQLLTVIGKGSFGKVMQVCKKDTGRIYAMKIIRKQNIVERDEVEHTIAERNVLAKISHPFIVNLKFSFQTPEKLYLVLAFVNGGELFKHLQDEGHFEESRSKFYTAELLLALDHLHQYDIIYRDLKPENILLDSNGHIALCDFGLCKLDMTKGKKTRTFCGTPEYLAPELLIGEGYTKEVDWWTLGVLLFEMLTGLPPYYAEDTKEMYQKILHAELIFPPEVSPLARSILSKLLERDPTRRLGVNGADQIKTDPFFGDINWTKLFERKVVPPWRPDVQSVTDTSNFDEEFTAMAPVDSVVESSHLSESVQQKFQGFSYIDDNKMTYAATPNMGGGMSMNQRPKAGF